MRDPEPKKPGEDVEDVEDDEPWLDLGDPGASPESHAGGR